LGKSVAGPGLMPGVMPDLIIDGKKALLFENG
jgi:hypothetical protein